MTQATICTICGRRLGKGAIGPFCGERCRVIDLGNWLDGTYQPPWLLDPEEVEALARIEERPPSSSSSDDFEDDLDDSDQDPDED